MSVHLLSRDHVDTDEILNDIVNFERLDISRTARIQPLITMKEPVITTLSFRPKTKQKCEYDFHKWTNEKFVLIVQNFILRLNNTPTTEMPKFDAYHFIHTKEETKYRDLIKSYEHSSTIHLRSPKSIWSNVHVRRPSGIVDIAVLHSRQLSIPAVQ